MAVSISASILLMVMGLKGGGVVVLRIRDDGVKHSYNSIALCYFLCRVRDADIDIYRGERSFFGVLRCVEYRVWIFGDCCLLLSGGGGCVD